MLKVFNPTFIFWILLIKGAKILVSKMVSLATMQYIKDKRARKVLNSGKNNKEEA